ncbi:hypothetical protein P167DRAFT_85343 [Morchella conica CCBAS932]|uniref:Uncharacterized protein n=1 Tax=Morchella conica CCBAS932 TaxID=1392247 RepID=A0A3N4L7A9_9PEZI|nr:hypothetical protein P167DRAFT_85343 [Morchella conica CCBAS932]
MFPSALLLNVWATAGCVLEWTNNFVLFLFVSYFVYMRNRRGNDQREGRPSCTRCTRTQISNFVVSRDLRWIARQYATRTFCESLEAKRNQNGRAHSFGAPRAE